MKPMRFSLRQLEYFVAIADAGTIVGASSVLHISQPGLSRSLTDLERALDVQLTVRRKAHGVTLTPTGRQVLTMARELLRSAHDIEGVASGSDALGGVLFVGCYVSLAPTALPPLLQEFAILHPGVDVEFVEGTQDVLQRRLLSGELDVAILYDMEVQPELNRVVIDTMRPHILIAESHPLALRSSVSLADLAHEPMVLLDAPPSSHNTLAIFERFGLVPEVLYRPTTFELTRALVGRGLGYALLVQRPANEQTYAGERVLVKEISEPVGESRVLIAWPKTVRLSRQAEAFISFCRKRAGDIEGVDRG